MLSLFGSKVLFGGQLILLPHQYRLKACDLLKREIINAFNINLMAMS